MSQVQTKKYEFDGLMQDIQQKPKGSKSCKDPHTKFTILTKPITNTEMDKLVYGGCYGFRLKLIIEVVEEKTEVTNGSLEK